MNISQTYSTHSETCTKFYDLVSDPTEVAQFVLSKVEPFQPKQGLFVGGFFLVAKELIKHGLNLTVCDYSDEMVAQGRSRLPATKVIKADLKCLPFENQFDSIFVIGRVFTHMLANDDAKSAICSLEKSLKTGGIVLFDNYENSKIRKTDYFNGQVIVDDARSRIVRDSFTTLVSEEPYIINWKANYLSSENGVVSRFQDQMLHRAFSRNEVEQFCEACGLEVVDQGDNFDETSFYTLAVKS